MVEMYVTLIKNGKRAIKDVPVKYRAEVEIRLKEEGLEHNV